MPPIPPIYIMPGIPRFKCPDFSVSISPVAPYKSGTPLIIAFVKNVTEKTEPKKPISFSLLFLMSENKSVVYEKLTCEYEKQNYSRQNICKRNV